MSDRLHQAVAALEAGNLAAAEQLVRTVLKQAPEDFNALHILGIALLRSGRPGDAIAPLRKAIRGFDRAAPVHHHLGLALAQYGRTDQAVAAFARATELDPAVADFWKNLATAQLATRRFDDALLSLDRATGLAPVEPAQDMVRGDALTALGQYDAAIAAFTRAAASPALSRDALRHRGVARHMAGHFVDAIADFDAVLRQDASDAELHFNRGQALLALSRFDEATDAYERALTLNADLTAAAVNLADIRLRHADWSGYTADAQRLASLAAAGKPVQTYLLANLSENPVAILSAARSFAAAQFPTVPPAPKRYPRRAQLRVAYVGGDFHDHPVGALLADVIAHHDRARVKVVGVSHGPDDGSAARAKLLAACDDVLDGRTMTDAQIAAWMRAQEIDIAVDVSAFTLLARQGILALRPAPVQVAYLAHPGSSGAAYLDYFITDRFITPPGFERHFSERIVRLPDTVFPPDPRAALPASPDRAQWGLPARGTVFCSFNTMSKISPVVFAVWMRILAGVAGSVLWVRAEGERTRANLQAAAVQSGIDPARVIFAERAPMDVHLARHACADLFLDTFPYSAGSTAAAAIAAGLPVLTCAGKTYVSRMCGSIVTSAGLPDLVTPSLAAYQDLAIRLGNDPAALHALRARLAENRAAAPFFDVTRLCRQLERAFEIVAHDPPSGSKPIDVPA